MTTKPVFHGSDIEKICEYYHLNKEDITNFGANVNPLGLSEKVKTCDCRASGSALILSGQGVHIAPADNLRILPYPGGIHSAGQRFQRADLTADRDTRTPAHAHPRSDLFRVFQRAVLLRKHTGILSSERRGKFSSGYRTASAGRLKTVMIFSSSVTRTIRLPQRSCTKIWNAFSHSALPGMFS